MLTNFQNSFTETLSRKFRNISVTADPTIPEMRLYTSLWNIYFQNLHRLQSRNDSSFTRSLCILWRECGYAKKTNTNSSFNTPSSTVCCHMGHFCDLGLKRTKYWRSDWSNPLCNIQLLKTVAEWRYLHLVHWYKSIRISRTEKFT